MKRVAVYVRVSTSDQNTELQKTELDNFLKSRGWVLHGLFEDKATGTNSNRPALKAMMAVARRREVDVVLCWKLDRFFRSLKDLVSTLQDFSELGIDFISLKDNIDLTTSSGRLMVHIVGAFAEFEASLIRERVRAGLENAKRNGKALGRPKRNKDLQILAMRRQGHSYLKIQNILGVSAGTIRRALQKAIVQEVGKLGVG